ncbi:S8 family serine peptidase [Halomonas denitrificans]|nr:S8 family serine peptidase [Halomonas denitrificans]
MRNVFFAAGLALVLSPYALAGETWLRIDRPDASLRADLPAAAIEYPGFVWLPDDTGAFRHQRAGGRLHAVADPFAMRIDGQRVDPRLAFGPAAQGAWRGTARTEADFRLVQFQGPIKGEWLEALRGVGAEPIQYIAPFGYIVWADQDAVARAATLARVRFAGEFPPVLRVPVQARTDADPHPYAMALIHAGTAERVLAALRDAGARTTDAVQRIDPNLATVQLHASPDLFESLGRVPGVLSIQQIGQDAGPRGEMSQQSVVGGWDAGLLIQPGYLDWLTPTGLDGSGVTVGIVDGGILQTHPDLVDNIVPCVPGGMGANSCSDASDSHGTHVAGAVGGTGASGTVDAAGFLRGQGVAPGASLVEQRYGPFLGGGPGGMAPNGMLTIYADSEASGAQLTNNSWGPTGTPQGYDIPTMEIDMISRDADPVEPGQQPVLAVWSIMNGNGDSGGACAPSSLGSPDEAKNLFAVGSTRLQFSNGTQDLDFFSVSGNSAHGPACDGRQVPHIVAPGCRTDSTSTGGSGYGLSCGTSMASPVVSGSVALYWEHYRNLHATDPSPALIKAVFTAAATDLVGNLDADNGTLGHRPDRKQGWGRLDLDAVINPPQSVVTFDQQTVFDATGQDWSIVLTPEDPAEPVRMMLAWTDAPGPGTGGTSPAWVNDLDLSVTASAGAYLGNVFGSDGFSATGGGPDPMNNLEGIHLRPDQHNGQPFTIEVLAANIAEDALDVHDPQSPRQDFALACYNCLAELPEDLFADGFESPAGAP